MRKICLIAISILFVLLASACQTINIRYDIYVTVYPMQYLVERIAGDTVTVGIVPGVSTHQESVDWSPKDIIAMTEASLLFYVGGNYDNYIDLQFDAVFSDANVELVKIESARDASGDLYVEFIPGIIHDHDHLLSLNPLVSETTTLGLDPHFWMSPRQIIKISRLVYDRLVDTYPENAASYLDNYIVLHEDLSALDLAMTAVMDAQTKTTLTATNVFGYLHEDYGFESISISPGYHEETEQFTTQQKEEIVSEAILHNITIIVYEKNKTSPLSNAVFATLTDLGYLPVKIEYYILETLYQVEHDAGKDYLSIMYENIALLEIATSDARQE